MAQQPAGGFMTGGRIQHLNKGWAIIPFTNARAHYWEEDTTTMLPEISKGGRIRYYEAACSLVAATNDRVPAFSPGSWPTCKNCLRALRQKR